MQTERNALGWAAVDLEAARTLAGLLNARDAIDTSGRIAPFAEIQLRDGETRRRMAGASRLAEWLHGTGRGPTLEALEKLPEDVRLAVAQLIEARARDEVAAWLRAWA